MAASPSVAELPEDTFAVILRAALPPPDEDGFLPTRAVASVCRAFSCCKSWRRALQRLLPGMEAPDGSNGDKTGIDAQGAQAPDNLPKGGLRLLCSASDGELEWLGTPWLPLTAAKFTHQLDRQSLCWEHGKGYAAAAASQQGEGGLEARHKIVLESLSPRSLPLLFLDFCDGPADLGYLPLRRRQLGAPSSPLGMLRLRCAGDLWLGSVEQARVRDVVAQRLWLEAPRIGIALERLIDEGSSGGATQLGGGQAGGWEGRLLSALELVADVAIDMVAATTTAAWAGLAGPAAPPTPPLPAGAGAAVDASTASATAAWPSLDPGLGGYGGVSGSLDGAGGAAAKPGGGGAGGLARLSLDDSGGIKHGCGAGSSGPRCLLRLVFKDLALLQVSPACTIRVSLLQLLQNAGLKHVNHTLKEGILVSLLPLPGRRFWWHLEVVQSTGVTVDGS